MRNLRNRNDELRKQLEKAELMMEEVKDNCSSWKSRALIAESKLLMLEAGAPEEVVEKVNERVKKMDALKEKNPEKNDEVFKNCLLLLQKERANHSYLKKSVQKVSKDPSIEEWKEKTKPKDLEETKNLIKRCQVAMKQDKRDMEETVTEVAFCLEETRRKKVETKSAKLVTNIKLTEDGEIEIVNSKLERVTDEFDSVIQDLDLSY